MLFINTLKIKKVIIFKKPFFNVNKYNYFLNLTVKTLIYYVKLRFIIADKFRAYRKFITDKLNLILKLRAVIIELFRLRKRFFFRLNCKKVG